MNNKGFISTVTIFAFFLVFLTFMTILMGLYSNSRTLLNESKNSLKEDLNYIEKTLEDYIPEFIGLESVTDNLGEAKYFPADSSDNWIMFAGNYWRIIGFNGDGSIRIIYSGDKITSDTTGVTSVNNNAYTNKTIFNNGERPEFLETSFYKYTLNGVVTDSTVKTVLDAWYNFNLLAYEEYIDMNTVFCADMSTYNGDLTISLGGTNKTINFNNTVLSGSVSTMYNSGNRLFSGSNEDLVCDSSSTYSMNSEDDRKLDKPIGLITLDELIFLGYSASAANINNYLYTGRDFYTMSPVGYYDNDGNVDTLSNAFLASYYVSSNGLIKYEYETLFEADIRPVISLKEDVILTGTGKYNDPYVVSGGA